MKINENLVRYNFSSRQETKIEYIVIHDTGNTSKGADANAHFSFLIQLTDKHQLTILLMIPKY